jgi:hypothetical protein
VSDIVRPYERGPVKLRPGIETYPGPHIPQPFEVRTICPEDPLTAATDIFNLTRMNWNTADIRGKWPVTLSFARRVGGILNEYGEAGSRGNLFPILRIDAGGAQKRL